MKRELAIALGVLVPFAALVALGLWFSPPTPPVALPPVAAPAALDAGVATARVDAPAAAKVEAPAPARAQEFPPELDAPLRAVTPEVRQCFEDQRGHVRGPARAKVAFTPTTDGRFMDVRVETGAQNPWLDACLADVFDEVAFTPSGSTRYEPASWTFELAPR